MTVTFGFDVTGREYAEIEIDDEELEGMSEEEIVEYAERQYTSEAEEDASRDCYYNIGQLETITINDKEHWVGC